jgi:hypothetical protein
MTPPDDGLERVWPDSLAYRNAHAQVETDLDRFAAMLSQAIPLLDVMSPAGGPRFHSRMVQVQTGDLTLSTEVHTPLYGSFGEDPGRASIFFPLLGEVELRIEGESLRARQGESVVFMPGRAYTAETTDCGGVVFSVDPQRLANLAAELAGDPSSSDRFLPAFGNPQQWQLTDPLQRQLLHLMRRAIGLIDTVPGNEQQLPGYLRLDDLLFRIVTVLVHPELLGLGVPFTPPRETGRAGES